MNCCKTDIICFSFSASVFFVTTVVNSVVLEVISVNVLLQSARKYLVAIIPYLCELSKYERERERESRVGKGRREGKKRWEEGRGKVTRR